jgi:hypothetical protein
LLPLLWLFLLPLFLLLCWLIVFELSPTPPTYVEILPGFPFLSFFAAHCLCLFLEGLLSSSLSTLSSLLFG